MAIANVPITSLPEATSPRADDYLILQGTNTQKIKWSALVNKIYPVGSLYMSTSSTSPANLFGGTWEQIKDRFILAAGDTYAAGSTGGEATHTLTEEELPEYNPEITVKSDVSSSYKRHAVASIEWTNLWSTYGYCISGLGGGKQHNNMPPYLTAYIWRRIA